MATKIVSIETWTGRDFWRNWLPWKMQARMAAERLLKEEGPWEEPACDGERLIVRTRGGFFQVALHDPRMFDIGYTFEKSPLKARRNAWSMVRCEPVAVPGAF